MLDLTETGMIVLSSGRVLNSEQRELFFMAARMTWITGRRQFGVLSDDETWAAHAYTDYRMAKNFPEHIMFSGGLTSETGSLKEVTNRMIVLLDPRMFLQVDLPECIVPSSAESDFIKDVIEKQFEVYT